MISKNNINSEFSVVNGDNESEVSDDSNKIDPNELRQTFFLPDMEDSLSAPCEISCFDLAKDKKTMCIGTNNTKAVLYFWEIASKSYLKSVNLINCVNPILLKFSDDSNYVLCYGIMSNYTGGIFYISVKQANILAISELMYSIPFKIKDISFLPSENNKFLTVGIQHTSLWEYKAGIL